MTAAFAAACGSAPQEDKGPVTYFRVEAEEIVTVGGGTNYAAVMIYPTPGMRWNDEFSANARVTDPGGLVPESLQFDNAAFRVRNDHARLNVPVSTTTPGSFKIQMALDFSICDQQVCKTFENVPVTIPFQVN